MLRDYALTTFVTLAVVVDPVGLAPTFLSITQGLSTRARREIGLRAAIIVAVAVICALTFLLATRVANLLGITGNVVLSRLLGVLLAALAVQFVIDGSRAAFG